jgi:hypothetical protein
MTLYFVASRGIVGMLSKVPRQQLDRNQLERL